MRLRSFACNILSHSFVLKFWFATRQWTLWGEKLIRLVCVPLVSFDQSLVHYVYSIVFWCFAECAGTFLCDEWKARVQINNNAVNCIFVKMFITAVLTIFKEYGNLSAFIIEDFVFWHFWLLTEIKAYS